jgi:ribosomal protein L11
MKRGWIVGAMALGMLAFVGTAARADEDYNKTLPAVAKNLAKAKLSLADGIKAAAKDGKPISAQYEIDEDSHKFQLSVFVSSGSDLLEEIVDFNTGAQKSLDNVVGDDITDAKKQKRGMDKATMSLADAVDAAAKGNPGYQVVQIVPALKGSDCVASIVLIKLDDPSHPKTVTQKM